MNDGLIYDVGMNNGDDTAHYLSKGHRVLAIEADPTLADAARVRFADEINAGHVTLLNVAIAPQAGIAKFWICPEMRVWNSFNKENASRNGIVPQAVDVECRPFRDILKEHGTPFYLKVDIEGHDRLCFEDLDRNDLPRYVSFEMGGTELPELVRSLGYDCFKCIDQRTFTPLTYNPYSMTTLQYLARRLSPHPRLVQMLQFPGRVKRKALKIMRGNGGMKAPAAIPRKVMPNGPPGAGYAPDSSGPFAEDTPGDWQTFEQSMFAWLAFRLGHTAAGPPRVGVWHDMHAKRSTQP